MVLEWLSINPHLIPSCVFFWGGGILLVLAPLMYQIRIKKIIILNPIKAIMHYTKLEKRILIIGIILLILGLISLILITKFYGYYYFDEGVPTWHKIK